eukprot:CAMPEP_0119267644 /NCGR_PEP_ID=MMETSP1329-20130426/5712_1 /TAXON_ID=114041 /ORGANISM="Genus nov. species nov., Strain RCC1024" /LENGTH=1109 /DNA_ID=CAMNT_0007267579 /DNA_START=194 /DNA_END=3519 /DNA_ORIENTATION=-
MADKPPPAPSKRRDALLAMERAVQQQWDREGTFEANAGAPGQPKFFVTFPYPYMNGRLHLGHAFSLTKAEFAAGFKRLRGHNVLFPFGFHCTGMPIQAAANKLKAEIQKYGNPPKFPEDAAPKAVEKVDDLEKEMAALGKKGKAKKTKTVSKGAGTSYQWQALEKMGIPASEIAAFAEPARWLEYFPPYGVQDLKTFGTSVDWRRSFITTDQNPYYDSFVRWQFHKLKNAEKIAFGKRANVYAVRDAQCCADHDRASGEGVGPQEYTLIKLQVIELPPCLRACGSAPVYLVPATLRPETMYGQTNCYILPEGEYGAFRQASGEIFVMSARAAVGLAHQGSFAPREGGPDVFTGYAKEWGQAERVGDLFKGRDLLGCPLKCPLATYERVYVLPLTTISMTKGTGVVTSVPSDAPDDWIALHELKEDAALRASWGLEERHVAFDVVPIIRIAVEASDDGKKEGWVSDASAAYWCEKLEIKSQKDAAKLKIAKGETYLNGFNYGVMLVGPHAGKKVSDAKPLVKQEMIAAGQALVYFEPESQIMSRSGEECIVAHTDQWYLKYGEKQWRDSVLKHVDETFEAYNAECLARFKYTLGWMKEWACSRLFGLGTKIPWDEGWVIESLSDSTIYMAYYTVAHILHGFGSQNLDGTQGLGAVPPEAMTPAVWEYVYQKDAPHPGRDCRVPDAILAAMKREFEFWYPMDLRVSGKDLIGNHLTMCLYNHAAVWPDEPETRWPRSMYTNGFVLLDNAKMSKSTGNFLMLDEACQLYSADAVRFALADAGDSLEDANFERKRADGAITMLFVEEEFARKVVSTAPGKDALHLRDAASPRDAYFVDRAFANEMRHLAAATLECYEAMRWRDGIQAGAFQLQLARDAYRDWCARSDVPMHRGLLRDYVALSSQLIAPVCPHFAHHVHRDVLGEAGPLRWPEARTVDKALQRSYGFLKGAARSLRLDAAKELKALKGKAPAGARVYVASTYPPWRKAVLREARAACAAAGGLVEKKDLLGGLKQAAAFQKGGEFGAQAKLAMQFGSFMHDYAAEVGLDAFDDTLPFSQVEILEQSKAYLSKCITPGKDLAVEIVDLDATADPPGPKKKWEQATPGKDLAVEIV